MMKARFIRVPIQQDIQRSQRLHMKPDAILRMATNGIKSTIPNTPRRRRDGRINAFHSVPGIAASLHATTRGSSADRLRQEIMANHDDHTLPRAPPACSLPKPQHFAAFYSSAGESRNSTNTYLEAPNAGSKKKNSTAR
jgi:hypothetical protein